MELRELDASKNGIIAQFTSAATTIAKLYNGTLPSPVSKENIHNSLINYLQL